MCISSQLKLNSQTDVSHFGFFGIFFVPFLFKTWKIYHSDKLKFSGGLNLLMDHGVGGRGRGCLSSPRSWSYQDLCQSQGDHSGPPRTPLVFSSYCFFQWGMDSYQQYEAQWEVTSLKTLWPVKLSVDKHGYPWHSSHPVSLGEYFPRVNASCTDMTVQWVWDCFSICVTDRYRKYFPKAFHYLIANSASHPSPDCNLHSWYLLI